MGRKDMEMSSLTRIVLSPDPETMSCRIHQEIESKQGNRLHRKEFLEYESTITYWLGGLVVKAPF